MGIKYNFGQLILKFFKKQFFVPLTVKYNIFKMVFAKLCLFCFHNKQKIRAVKI